VAEGDAAKGDAGFKPRLDPQDALGPLGPWRERRLVTTQLVEPGQEITSEAFVQPVLDPADVVERALLVGASEAGRLRLD
jgi:hypothetical protein